MKNMKNSTKKWLTVAGCLAVCAVLVVLIGVRMQTGRPTDAPLPSQSAQPSDVTVEPITKPTETEKEKVIVVPPIEIPDLEEPENGVDTGTEQTIQPDVLEKPVYTEEQLKDQTQTPDGKPVATPPPAVDHDQVEPPKVPPKDDSQPQGGDTQDGKIYVPGFGWIEDIGEGQGTVIDGDGDINKQVGIMGE